MIHKFNKKLVFDSRARRLEFQQQQSTAMILSGRQSFPSKVNMKAVAELQRRSKGFMTLAAAYE